MACSGSTEDVASATLYERHARKERLRPVSGERPAEATGSKRGANKLQCWMWMGHTAGSSQGQRLLRAGSPALPSGPGPRQLILRGRYTSLPPK